VVLLAGILLLLSSPPALTAQIVGLRRRNGSGYFPSGEVSTLFVSLILSLAERYPQFARACSLKLRVSMSGKGKSPELNSFV
jgi:hypothetical protein